MIVLMSDRNPQYVGLVQERPKLSEKFQRQELVKFGCAPERIVHIDEFDDFVSKISPQRGHVVLIYRVDVLAGKKKKGEPLPRVPMRERVRALRKTKVPVVEVSTNRHCGDGDNMLDMVMDAYDRLAGNKSATDKIGRPAKEKTPAEIENGKLIWKSNVYATNEEALEALQKLGWTCHLMNKYEFGGSGRKAGKPKGK